MNNVLSFVNCASFIALTYYKLGGFVSETKYPILLKLRHSIIICIPSLIISPLLTGYFCEVKIN